MSNECQKGRTVCALGDAWGWRCVKTVGRVWRAARWCGQAGYLPVPVGCASVSSAQSYRGTVLGATPLHGTTTTKPLHLERGERSPPALKAEVPGHGRPLGRVSFPFALPSRADEGRLSVLTQSPPAGSSYVPFWDCPAWFITKSRQVDDCLCLQSNLH